jgi:ArsR family transcriptional regulator
MNIVILQYTNITMGASKTDHFTKKQNELANQLKAMAHPARIAIIEFLLKTEGCICSDIVNELPLAQPTVSQHLKELKNAGIIKGNIEGNAICYCLEEKSIANIQTYFGLLSNKISQQKSKAACC